MADNVQIMRPKRHLDVSSTPYSRYSPPPPTPRPTKQSKVGGGGGGGGSGGSKPNGSKKAPKAVGSPEVPPPAPPPLTALDLIKQMRMQAKIDLFDSPPPASLPGYYDAEIDGKNARTTWGTGVMCFDHMIKKARSGGYGSTPTEWISNVEADLLVLVSNAIIYYGHAHTTNQAALAVYEAVQAVLQEWQAFHLLCSVCGGDELDAENSVTICDGCCKGFHRLCTKETLEGETPHDLRRDSAWYCSNACRSSFEALASRFQLADDFRGVQVVPEVPANPSPALEVHAYHAALGVVLFELPGEGGERSGFKWPGLVSRPSTPEQVAEASLKNDHALVLSLETEGSNCTWSLAVGLLQVAHGDGDDRGGMGQQEVMEHALRHPDSKRKDFWAALSWAKRAHDGNVLLPSTSSALGAATAGSADAEPDQGSLDSSKTSKRDRIPPVAPPGEPAAPPGAPVAPPGEPAAPPGAPVAPPGEPAAPPGAPVAPPGEPAAPPGEPAAPPGAPVAPPGEPAAPPGAPVAPTGEPAAPPGAPVAPPGAPVAPPGTSSAPPAAALPPTTSLASLHPPSPGSLSCTAPVVADSKSPSQHEGKIGGGWGAREASPTSQAREQGNGSPAAPVAVVAGGRKKQKANIVLDAPYCKICHRRGYCCHFQGSAGGGVSGGNRAASGPGPPSFGGTAVVGGVSSSASAGGNPSAQRSTVPWSGRCKDPTMQLGVHSPTAATLIGAEYGVDKSGYVCGFCSKNGHEEYECPVHWMATFPTEGPLPGFTPDGDVVAEDWEGENLLATVLARKWIALRQKGYFQFAAGAVRSNTRYPHPVDSIVRLGAQMRTREELQNKLKAREEERQRVGSQQQQGPLLTSPQGAGRQGEKIDFSAGKPTPVTAVAVPVSAAEAGSRSEVNIMVTSKRASCSGAGNSASNNRDASQLVNLHTPHGVAGHTSFKYKGVRMAPGGGFTAQGPHWYQGMEAAAGVYETEMLAARAHDIAWARASMHGHVVSHHDINFPCDWPALTQFCEIAWGSERKGRGGGARAELKEGGQGGEKGGGVAGKVEPDGRGGNLEDEGEAFVDDEAKSSLEAFLEKQAEGENFPSNTDEIGGGVGIAFRLRAMCRFAASNLSQIEHRLDDWPRCLRANIVELHSRVQEYLDGAAHQKFLSGSTTEGGLASSGDAVTYLLALEALQEDAVRERSARVSYATALQRFADADKKTCRADLDLLLELWDKERGVVVSALGEALSTARRLFGSWDLDESRGGDGNIDRERDEGGN